MKRLKVVPCGFIEKARSCLIAMSPHMRIFGHLEGAELARRHTQDTEQRVELDIPRPWGRRHNREAGRKLIMSNLGEIDIRGRRVTE